jgi:general secretion pathway protein B
MSYILEALKKSEARRRDGQAPDLTQTPPQTARRPGRWPLLLLTVLVVGAGSALGVWLATNRDADSTEMAQDTGPAQSATTGAGETGTQTTDPADQPTTHVAIAARVRRAAGRSRPEPAAPQDDGNLTQPAPDTTRGTTTDATAEPTAGVPATGSAVAGTEAEPGIDVAQDPPPQELPEMSTGTVADAASPPNPLDELTARAAEYLEPRSEPETAEPEPIEPGPPLIHELGWTFRSQLPQLALNVHMYSEDPAQRFVLINMRRYQEGDVMENSGILIQQVVAEGVILNHAGRDFLLGR